MKTTKHWYNYLWIWSIVYLTLGFFNILFAWLGMIMFLLPLIIAATAGSKAFCSRYCDRGQLLRLLGTELGWSRYHDVPGWLKSRSFRYGFLAFFLTMFGNVLYVTWLVSAGSRSVKEALTLFWTFDVPWHWAATAAIPPWAAQFAFGLYSLMVTSLILALITMLLYKPRSWCVYCPMGTMTQLICRAKAPKDAGGAGRETAPEEKPQEGR